MYRIFRQDAGCDTLFWRYFVWISHAQYCTVVSHALRGMSDSTISSSASKSGSVGKPPDQVWQFFQKDSMKTQMGSSFSKHEQETL